jgi:exonuclease VII small subunit
MATATAKVDTKVKDALDHVRAAAQELHGAISDAAAKRGGAVKADLEAIPQKAKAVTESVKASIGAQNEAAKKQLTDAVTHLEATHKQLTESLKSSGQAFQTSVTKALAEARTSVQKISEAVAAKRSAQSKQNPKN